MLTPDLPKHPKEALEFIHQLCDKEKPEMSMRVEKIFIMKSERIEGALIYSEVLSNSY